MSSDHTSPEPAPRDRREAVREKAQQVRAQQSRARLLRRAALIAGVVVAVAAAGVVVAWAVVSTVSRPQLTPANDVGDGFAVTSVTGVADAPVAGVDSGTQATPAAEPTETATAEPTPTASADVDIHVYVDYLSPGAREWQLANAKQLSSWLTEGAATLTYHPVSVLTAKSNGTKYSLRAASAAACVATYEPAKFFAFNNELLTRQPAVDSDGFSDVELAEIAIAKGANDPKRLRTCIETEAFATWAREATERAVSGIPNTDGLTLTGTPMVLVNGQQYVGALGDPAEFSQFVLTNASGAFYKEKAATPTPTPTPTPSTTP